MPRTRTTPRALPFALLVALAAPLAACTFGSGDRDSGGGMVQTDPPTTSIPAGGGAGADSGSPETCGAGDLCARSIDDCGVALEPEVCEAWYAESGSCRDMDAYLACNCDCLEEPACDGYFACGEFCFDAHCS